MLKKCPELTLIRKIDEIADGENEIINPGYPDYCD